MTVEAKTPLRQVAEDGYYRRGHSPDFTEGVLPPWIWRIGMYVSIADESIKKVEAGESESLGFTEQASSKFKVISQSLRFSTSEDVNAFDSLITSIRQFWPQLGSFRASEYVAEDNKKNRYLMPSDAQRFVNTAEEWLKGEVADPISAEAICSWFDSLGGLACSDPAVVRKYFSSGGVYPVPPLAGWEGLEGGGKLDGRSVFHEEVKRTWALNNIRRFSNGCADILEAKAEGVMQDNPNLAEQMRKIMLSARNLEEFLKQVGESSYREMDLLRPTPAENTLVPIGVALAEELSEEKATGSPEADESIARSLVRVFRRRRVSVGREGILGFCGAFSDPEKVSKQSLPAEGLFAGVGLDVIGDHSKGRREIVNRVQSKIIPEFVYQMRLMGYHTFEWTDDDYQALGFDENLWEIHNERLEKTMREKVSGEELVENGDSVNEFSGEFDPLHEGHIQLAWEVAEDFTQEELIRAGFITKHSKGKLVVGVNVNTGNTVKRSKEAPIRRRIVENGLLNIKNIFIHTDTHASLPTADRMDLYKEGYEMDGVKLDSQTRLTGFDKPKGNGFVYTEDEEPGGSDRLNATGHIFSVQLEDLTNPYDLGRKIKAAFGEPESGDNKYDGKVIVMLVHLAEVHSTYIRNHINELSDEVLATLVHPRDVPLIRELYSRK